MSPLKLQVGKGALAGLWTAFIFAGVHHWLISDIWFSMVPMGLAGLACGASLTWTHRLHFPRPSWQNWLAFMGLQTALLFLLGLASVAVFDPIIPFAVAAAMGEPPREMFIKALPLTAAFVVAGAVLVSLLWGRNVKKFGVAFVSSLLLMTLLGLNVSILGLVEFTRDAVPVLSRFFGLIAFIMAFFALSNLLAQRIKLPAQSKMPRQAVRH
jgi:hypothetical protein